MLPSAPKDVGRLSDVFTSALASAGGLGENRLRLAKVKHSVVVLVDGLGYENLKGATAYARFLNQNLDTALRCEFPSTTATSITGFSTGSRSNKHGLIGYSVFNRKSNEQMNLLTGWSSQDEAVKFKQVSTIAESEPAIPIFSIGPKAYENSGLTALTMAGANYVGAERIAERFEAAEQIIRRENSSLSYLYVPELDQIAHKFGVESNDWLYALEELDLIVNRFASKLGSDVGVLLTADHGVVDVPHDQHIYLDEFDWYTSATVATTGDPRCNFVYMHTSNEIDELKTRLIDEFGQAAYVVSPDELMRAGWLGEFSPKQSDLLPDLFIIWRDQLVAYDRRFAKPSHLKMIGQHGAISDPEMRIPLIKLGKY